MGIGDATHDLTRAARTAAHRAVCKPAAAEAAACSSFRPPRSSNASAVLCAAAAPVQGGERAVRHMQRKNAMYGYACCCGTPQHRKRAALITKMVLRPA